MAEETMHSSVTDEEIIQALKQGGAARKKGVANLYQRHMTLVIKIQRRFKLDRDTALDAYTDGIIKTSRYIESGKFRQDSSIFTLLYQIEVIKTFFNSKKKLRYL
jgi:hypothetical protein